MRRCVYRKQLDLETLVAAYHTSVAILPQNANCGLVMDGRLDFRRQAVA